MAASFEGRFPFSGATAFLFFREGSPYRKLLHRFKYGGEPEIGFYMGMLFGKELYGSYKKKGAPVVVPVPMSSWKRRKRGYNQAEWLAAGIAASAGWTMASYAVKRVRENKSQTTKDKEGRRENMKNAFVAHPVPYDRLLLVDDVITTGATMDSCSLSILEKNPGIELSLASLAYVE